MRPINPAFQSAASRAEAVDPSSSYGGTVSWVDVN